MPHNRTPKPGAKYYLPKYRYKTVVNYCLQYRELKDELRTLDGWHGSGHDGQPRGNETSDPTAGEAIRRTEISKKIDLIEKTIKAHSGEILYPYMLKGITEEECTYAYLSSVMKIPLGKNQYTLLRRKIYYNISKKI